MLDVPFFFQTRFFFRVSRWYYPFTARGARPKRSHIRRDSTRRALEASRALVALVDGRGAGAVAVRPRRAVHRLVFSGEAEVACRARMLSVVSDSLPEHFVFFQLSGGQIVCELRGWGVGGVCCPRRKKRGWISIDS